jgi:hypothetical protein
MALFRKFPAPADLLLNNFAETVFSTFDGNALHERGARSPCAPADQSDGSSSWETMPNLDEQ